MRLQHSQTAVLLAPLLAAATWLAEAPAAEPVVVAAPVDTVETHPTVVETVTADKVAVASGHVDDVVVSERADADDAEAYLESGSARIADVARRFVDREPWGTRQDCSGFVIGVLDHVGIEVAGGTADIWKSALKEGQVHFNPIPKLGDLAVFDNTHDRNGNGRWDDPLTHIAVVVDVEEDGTIVLAHRGSSRALIRMNLLHPHDRKDADGEEINSYLRRTYYDGRESAAHLTGALWSGFVTPTSGADTAR